MKKVAFIVNQNEAKAKEALADQETNGAALEASKKILVVDKQAAEEGREDDEDSSLCERADDSFIDVRDKDFHLEAARRRKDFDQLTRDKDATLRHDVEQDLDKSQRLKLDLQQK